jgi:hypothetical protein
MIISIATLVAVRMNESACFGVIDGFGISMEYWWCLGIMHPPRMKFCEHKI